MSTLYLTYTDPAAQPAIRKMMRAFPAYSGRTFKVRVTEHPINVRSYWDGGSRDYFAFVSLVDDRTTPTVPAQSGYDPMIAGTEAVPLPVDVACVQHTIFCGKDRGLTLIVGPANAPGLLPAPSTLTDDEARVLILTAGLKNTYGGETDIRFRHSGLTRTTWDTATVNLKARKLLNGAGAITPDGRNAVANHPQRHCDDFRTRNANNYLVTRQEPITD